MSLSTFPLYPQPYQFFDNNGAPLANGQIFTYYAQTLNAAPTYVDSLGVASNPNPIVLDPSGLGFIFGAANISYKIVVADANGVTLPGRTVDNYNFGSGLLAGAVTITGEQTVTGNKTFSGITAFGPGANTEYDSGIYNAIFGAVAANIGGFEIVSSKSANISATTSEGVLDGSLEYDHTTDTWNFRTAGTIRFVLSNTAVNFPTAASLTANGQSFLTNASIVQIATGGTGQTTAPNALLALVPPVAGNTGNALTTDGATVKWGSTLGTITLLASPAIFFNGTQQTAWTTYNPVASGVANGSTKVLIQAYGSTFGPGPGGTILIFACARANASYGNDAGHPESNTFVLLAGDVQNSSAVEGSGCSATVWCPLRANTTFDYIVPNYSGYKWQNLVLSIVGYS